MAPVWIHPCPVVLVQVCRTLPLKAPERLPHSSLASVQRFSDQANVPEYLNYKQILSHRWLQIPLPGNPLQTLRDEINPPSPDWPAVPMLRLSGLGPHLDVCVASLLSRMSRSPKPDRCCRGSARAAKRPVSRLSRSPAGCLGALENESSLARSYRISYLFFFLSPCALILCKHRNQLPALSGRCRPAVMSQCDTSLQSPD